MAYDLIFAMVEKIKKMEAGSAVPSEASAPALQRFKFGAQLAGGTLHWSAAGTGGALTVAPLATPSSHVEVAAPSAWSNHPPPSHKALGAPPAALKESLEDQHQPAHPPPDARTEEAAKKLFFQKPGQRRQR